MPDAKKTPPQKLPDEPQPLVGFMTNEEWDALLGRVDALVREMDDLPFPDVKEKIFTLLAGIDTIHRESLGRLVRLFKEGVLEKVVSDPAIHTLMELYDLLPPEARVTDDQASKIQWTMNDAKAEAAPSEAAPARPTYAHWVPVLQTTDELPCGTVKECVFDDHSILLCRVKDAFYAMDSACVKDGASLAKATLAKYTLTCPNHTGCYYDTRQGAHIAGKSMLKCYPVKLEENGRVLIGIGMDFIPKLPAF